AIGIPERVQRRAVHIGNGWIRPQWWRGVEVRTIRGVVPPGREVRRDVGGVLVDLHRLGEVHLLPARRRLAGEGGAGQQLTGRAPQAADMRAGVGAGLVEPDPGDVTKGVRLEFHSHSDRGRVTRINGLRSGGWSPETSAAAHLYVSS